MLDFNKETTKISRRSHGFRRMIAFAFGLDTFPVSFHFSSLTRHLTIPPTKQGLKTLFLCFLGTLKRRHPQGEVKGGTLPGRGLGPDRAAVARDDPVHAGQANAGAVKLRLVMEPLKSAKQLV